MIAAGKGEFHEAFLLAITAASVLAAPASAFINPRAHGWWNEVPASLQGHRDGQGLDLIRPPAMSRRVNLDTQRFE